MTLYFIFCHLRFRIRKEIWKQIPLFWTTTSAAYNTGLMSLIAAASNPQQLKFKQNITAITFAMLFN